MTTLPLPRRPTPLLAPVVALVLGVVVVLAARWGPDWPAQEFRAWAASHEGLGVWTNRWYGGQALPSYSVLYPVVANVLGAGLTGLLSSVGAAWACAAFAPAARWRARLFYLSVGFGLTENLLIGQVPFLLGVAFGAVAVRALLRGGPVVVIAGFAALAGLSSPLAGVFLLVVAPAGAMAVGRRRAAGLLAALVGPGVSVVVGGSGGSFPFEWLGLLGVVIFCSVLAVAARTNRPLQCFALCYLLASVAAFVIPDPVGGNMARLGKLIALPLACHLFVALRGSRRVAALAATVLAFSWAGVPFASSIARGATDPSRNEAYYTGLVGFLKTQNPNAGRVEVPFTREHWESFFVARSFPIARGWERQTDLRYNAVLYAGLTAATYRRWLDDNAVSLVAVPDVPIDYGGQAEEAVIDQAPAYLRPIWHDSNWTVLRVTDPNPLVTGAATLVQLGTSSIVVHFDRPGTATVRVRESNLWQVRGRYGCVDSTPRGWLTIHTDRPGTVTVDASIAGGLIGPTQACASAPGG